MDETRRTINCLRVIDTSRGEKDLKKTWIETVRNNLEALNLTI